MRNVRTSAVLVTAMALVAVACASGNRAGAEVEAFCDTAVQADMVISAGPDVDFETATEEEVVQALGAFAATVNPLLDQLVAQAPAEIEQPVAVVSDKLSSALETGDDSFSEASDFVAADQAIDQFLVGNCGFQTAAIQAVDYAFVGVPETMKPGVVALDFSNQGTEFHEIVIFRIKDGVSESATELLQLPEEEGNEKAEFVSVGFAGPGESTTLFLEMRAGRYAFVCFLPVGATPEMMETMGDGGEGGPPHFTQGMVAEVTVQG